MPNFFLPQQQKQQREVERMKSVAQAMRDYGQQTPNEMVSGIVVKKSPLEGLAKALGTAGAGYYEGKARRAEDDLAAQRNVKIAEILGGNPELAQIAQIDPQMALEAKVKSMTSGSTPAAMQMADAYLQALQSGDTQRAQALQEFAKTQDKGLVRLPDGSYAPLVGYGEALGANEYGKQSGKNRADLEYQPSIAGEKAKAEEIGKAQGQEMTSLADRESSLPRLEQVVTELSDLGKNATYTLAGQGRDYLTRQLGLPMGEGAIARKEYIAKVDNEILPLLRQTFGAAFTQKEGESLKATLGDVNASPEEKDAVLRSFIDQKRAQINSLKQRTGQGSPTETISLEDFLNEGM